MKKVLLALLAAVFVAALAVFASAYSNPLKLEANGSEISVGDPFILKYNGTYYMYPSNYSGYAWKSTDLVNWVCIGQPFQGEHTLNLFAPEVFYSNGYFYCISASEGTTNYALRSKSPEGPFTAVSGDLGMDIDTTFFRDDDGTVYIANAGFKKLNLYRLSDMQTVGSHLADIPVSISDSWTEGPTIFKRNDIYYLTYTGNHVLDYSYRVEWAYSEKGVDGGWVEPENNVLLLDANSENRGLGHNSIIIGPDLDTYYIVYHNLVTEGDPNRRVDIDRIFWNGIKPCVTHTRYDAENPALPKFEERYSDPAFPNWTIEGNLSQIGNCLAELSGRMLLSKVTDDIYTAEINIVPDGATVYFAYQNDENYASLEFSGQTMTYSLCKNGQKQNQTSVALPKDTDLSSLQCIKIQQSATALNIFFDGAKKLSLSPLSGGKLSVKGNTTVGYIAFSDVALGNKDAFAAKYLPSSVDACLANNSDALDSVLSAHRLGNALLLSKNDFARFEVTATADSKYSFALLGMARQDAAISILVDGTPVLSGLYIGMTDKYAYTFIRGIALSNGNHTLEIKISEGVYEFYGFESDVAQPAEIANYPLNMLPFEFTVTNGKIKVSDGALILHQNYYNPVNHTVALVKNYMISDCSVTVTLKNLKAKQAGIVLRAQCSTAPAQTSGGQSVFKEAYYQQCYFVSVEDGAVVLHKYNFGDNVLVRSAKIKIKDGDKLRAEVCGSTISAFVNDALMFSYSDNNAPYLFGKYGLMSALGEASFKDLEIKPVACEYVYVDKNGQTFVSTEHLISNTDGIRPPDELPKSRSPLFTVLTAAVSAAAVAVLIIVKRKKRA